MFSDFSELLKTSLSAATPADPLSEGGMVRCKAGAVKYFAGEMLSEATKRVLFSPFLLLIEGT